MPFKIVPSAPPVVASDVDSIGNGLVNDFSIVNDGLLPQQITFITHSIFCDDDGLLVFLPVSFKTGS